MIVRLVASTTRMVREKKEFDLVTRESRGGDRETKSWTR